MIKFFRKIRQKLLSENKFSKYLIYAIGEILLVVIGILIALQINTWNENRKDKNLEQIFISRLLDDIEQEEAFLQTYFQYNTQVSNFANKVSHHFNNPESALKTPKQSLIDFYQASQINNVRQSASTYKELNTSGKINLLRNYELRTLVIKYYELNWSELNVFKIPNKYRESLRSIMPNSIQKKIRNNCGDRYIETKNSIAIELPENCEIDIDNEIAKIDLRHLLNDSELKKDLNYLVGNIDSQLELVKILQEDLKEIKVELEQSEK